VRHASTWWKPWTKVQPSPSSATPSSLGEDILSLESDQADTSASALTYASSHFPETPEAVLAVLQATNAGEHASIAAAKADAFFTSSWCMEAFQYAHESWGLPWWGSIAVINLIGRGAMLPLAVYSQKVTAGIAVTQKDLLPAKKLQALSQQTTDAAARDRYAKAAQKYVSEHMATHGDPRKKMLAIPLVLVGSAAIFMSIFNGVRVLMSSGAHSLTQGGMLWFTDLTSPDPYHGLPILCAAATMGMVKFGMNLGSEESSPMAGSNAQQAKILRYFLLGASLTFIPAGQFVSAGVAVLWTVNSCFAIVQGLAMRNPRVRIMLGIPTLEEMKRISQEVASANKAFEVDLNVEKSLAERAAEAERKLGIDEGGRKAVLFTQPPRRKKGPRL